MSQDQSDRTGSYDGVIRGEVVRPGEDDEASSSSQAGHQQTYLHKVASARPAGPAPAAHGNAGSEQALAEDSEATNGNAAEHNGLADDAAAASSGDTTADEALATDPDATSEDPVTGDALAMETDATSDDAAEDALAMETDATSDDAAGDALATSTDATSEDTVTRDALAMDTDATSDDAADDATATSPNAVVDATRPDAVVDDAPAGDAAGGELPGRHRAEEPEEPGSDVPQARRPGDVTVPPELEGSLLADATGIRAQWMRVQGQFVDDPRIAVNNGANILTDVASQLEAAVRERQQALRARWDGNGKADTEALRVMMQQYRALLDRLTSM